MFDWFLYCRCVACKKKTSVNTIRTFNSLTIKVSKALKLKCTYSYFYIYSNHYENYQWKGFGRFSYLFFLSTFLRSESVTLFRLQFASSSFPAIQLFCSSSSFSHYPLLKRNVTLFRLKFTFFSFPTSKTSECNFLSALLRVFNLFFHDSTSHLPFLRLEYNLFSVQISVPFVNVKTFSVIIFQSCYRITMICPTNRSWQKNWLLMLEFRNILYVQVKKIWLNIFFCGSLTKLFLEEFL